MLMTCASAGPYPQLFMMHSSARRPKKRLSTNAHGLLGRAATIEWQTSAAADDACRRHAASTARAAQLMPLLALDTTLDLPCPETIRVKCPAAAVAFVLMHVLFCILAVIGDAPHAHQCCPPRAHLFQLMLVIHTTNADSEPRPAHAGPTHPRPADVYDAQQCVPPRQILH